MNRFVFVLCFLLLFAVEGLAQVVDIPDSHLRVVVERNLGKRSGAAITADDMLRLGELYADWQWDIRDLTGLEYATNLRRLDLSGNRSLSDVSPLSKLSQLDRLILRDCAVSDLSPLSGLLRLRTLDLSFNQVVSDLSPLAGLILLNDLEFRRNLVTDVSPLSGLISLDYISMNGNLISDVSPLLSNGGLGDGDLIEAYENPLNDDSLTNDLPALGRKGVYVNIANLVSDISVEEPLRVGDTFTYDFKIENAVDIVGWQFTLTYDSSVLTLQSITYGDFLASGNGTALPAKGDMVNASDLSINREANRNWIRDLYQVRLKGAASGDGILYSCTFRIDAIGYTGIWMPDAFMLTSNGHRIRAGYFFDNYQVDDRASVDVNGDGKVDLADVAEIAQHIGTDRREYDVDNNRQVNIADMIYVIQRFGTTPRAPSTMTVPEGLTTAMVREWIDMAHTADDGSQMFRRGIAVFNLLLEMIPPKETVLLANYPNPFNPETWIPYHLSNDADVTLTIYDTQGAVVRQFDLGHQSAGYYTDRGQAIYWDGRNSAGETVSTGVYFYHLDTGDYSQTRKMLILK